MTAADAGRSAARAVVASRRLGPSYDLLAAYRPGGPQAAGSFFFERAGLGVAGVAGGGEIGVPVGADRIERAASEARRVLASLGGRGSAEPAPLVAGAIAFGEDEPSSLSVLADCAIRRVPGATWRLRVDPTAAGVQAGGKASPATGYPPRPAGRRASVRTAPGAAFDESAVRAEPEGDAYVRAVQEALRRIERGDLEKVVLSRSLVLDAGRDLDPRELIGRLRAVDPDAFVFAVPTRRGVLVGASPELLVSRRAGQVRSTPLAGSAPRFGDPDRDRESGAALVASTKERAEHDVVADAVEAALRPLCDELERDGEPVLLGTANVWHLSTRFRGVLRDPATDALDLVAALHPTPAVCGEPRDVARDAIADLEVSDRGCYAGPVGWMDAHGDGEWAIALRCAELSGTRARLFAGAGIVRGSDPVRELEETERKFRALLDSLRWG
jgi:isochorismate synthase